MSWDIKKIGERTAVKRAVENETNLPANVKQAILDTIHDKLPEHSKEWTGLRVEGYGHHNAGDGSSMGNIGKLEVEPFQLTT
jgi:hypothetical protein